MGFLGYAGFGYQLTNVFEIEADFTTQTPNLHIAMIDKTSPLHIAIQKENLDIINLLLHNEKLNINLITASRSIYGFEIGQYMLARVESNEATALHDAIEKGNAQIVQLLLQRPDIDVNKTLTHIIFGVKDGDITGRRILYKDEETVLQLAIKKGNIEILRCLLNHEGIDINCKSIEEERIT